MFEILSCTNNGAPTLAVQAGYCMMAMPDGIKLYTEIVAPAGASQAPIVLLRSPYCTKDSPLQTFCDRQYEWLRAGYSVVHQHCRGTGLSEGEFIPYINERSDGLATLQHLHDLPFYADEVYLYGGSYLSSVHYAYLGCLPPEVKGAVLCVQDANRYNIHYRNGCYKVSVRPAHIPACVSRDYIST